MKDTPSDSRLAASRSPFLLHGAGQPVDWWPFGPDAFDHARTLDRPVLLDIGAVWCHWCHVMDRESYEDDQTAALINELFVPVKVDRDERPDIDARYQRAVQLLTGQGGWPLTAFLTPAGDVFYGGTYFPPDDAYGRPSFQRVLREIARVWRDERDRAADAARGVVARLEAYTRSETEAGSPSLQIVEETLEELAGSFDFRFGGFGRAPKFPSAGALDLLIDRHMDAETDWAGQIVRVTLTAMARGGITDQIGGGVHRYSTDARWIIPHFEKMAYDNGPLLTTNAVAAVVLGDARFAGVARGIVAHYRDIAGDLVDFGGFPASQDADHGFDNDGDYWTWTVEEVADALGDDVDADIARLAFGFNDAAGRMHLDPSRHVLFDAADPSVIADTLEMDRRGIEDRLSSIRVRLKARRDLRPAPYIDRTLYSGWCALVASGHIAADRYLAMHDAGRAGIRALERIWQEAWVSGQGVRHRLGDDETGFFLDDQAMVLGAFVDAFELTQEDAWFERALSVGRVLADRFATDSGALADRPTDDASVPALTRVHVPIADSPTPSGNGAAALALLRLDALGAPDWCRDRAGMILDALSGTAARLHGSAATFVKAVSWLVAPVTSVLLVDESDRDGADEMLRAALACYRPRTVIRRMLPTSVHSASMPDALRAVVDARLPRAYVCTGNVCAMPVSTPADLTRTLREFRVRGHAHESSP